LLTSQQTMAKCDRENPAEVDAAEAKRLRKEAKKAAAAAAAAAAETVEAAGDDVVEDEPKKNKKTKKVKNIEAEGDTVVEEEPTKNKKSKKHTDNVVPEVDDEQTELPKRKKAKKATIEADTAADVADDDDNQKKAKGKKKKNKTEDVDSAEVAAEVAEDAEVQEKPKGKKKKNQDVESEQKTKKAKTDAGDKEEEEEQDASKPASTEAASTSGKDEPNLRVFVGSLAWSVTEETLKKDFSECGEITDCHLLTDKESGRSRGIAFITFKDEAGVQAALKFDGEDYAGRPLNVAISNKEGNKGKGKGKGKDGKGKGKGKDGKGKGKGPAQKPDGCTSVVVKGLSYEVTDDDLYTAFKDCGSSGPSNVKVLTDRDTGASKGIAFVDFDDTSAVDAAMKLSETELKGRCFFMDYARPRD